MRFAGGTSKIGKEAILAAESSTVDLSGLVEGEEPPLAVESDVSSEEDVSSVSNYLDIAVEDNDDDDDDIKIKEEYVPLPTSNKTLPVPRREPLQWEFHGFTVWIELEEFGNDLTRSIHDMAAMHGTSVIPKSHMTAIYGMNHLSAEEACARLRSVPDRIKAWPKFKRPVGVVQDVAIAGNPGQVCSIAWAQLTLSSGPDHEESIDALYSIFFGMNSEEKANRHRPWTPHNSIAYDNPEDTVLTLEATLACIARYPTLLGRERRVEAISLWSTEGKMQDWKCLERVHFPKE